ncbi:DUF2535 family protein [Priestia abyssalis]|uniref:DUF2535 family protein n=1 Tax=Priestia abyssalis TaxID=1221450 RepID=UPI000995B62B|nr:DUF2535 family protein [Priestia abyssalis]
MLFKSLEFKHLNEQKVKVIEIPVLEDDNPYRFMISIRLEAFINKIYNNQNPKKVYSFKEYLKRVLKWKQYELVFKEDILKHNA